MFQYIWFILFTVTTTAAAQILLKHGMMAFPNLNAARDGYIETVLKVLFQPYVFLGFCVLVISMVSHLYVLSKVDLSFAYPFLSLAYVIVLAWGFFVFKEQIGTVRLAGVALICLGTILVAQS